MTSTRGAASVGVDPIPSTRATSPASCPTQLEAAILQSVAYAAVFEYPLTLAQLRETLVGMTATACEVERCCEASDYLRARIECHDGYYVPAGGAHMIQGRSDRERTSLETLRRHRQLLRALCVVPYTRLVALSGSLAHLNGPASADLDLFVVTDGPRVWSVTVAMVVLAKLWGQRRVVCVNYVVSDRRLRLHQQDLFTANQVVHLKPLHGAAVYQRFLDANPFVAECYPNHARIVEARPEGELGAALSALKAVLEGVGRIGPSQLLEFACRSLYGAYLRRQASRWRSPDQVRLERECLKLHTHSHRTRVLTALSEAVQGPRPKD